VKPCGPTAGRSEDGTPGSVGSAGCRFPEGVISRVHNGSGALISSSAAGRGYEIIPTLDKNDESFVGGQSFVDTVAHLLSFPRLAQSEMGIGLLGAQAEAATAVAA
jgi:hypothetical protein